MQLWQQGCKVERLESRDGVTHWVWDDEGMTNTGLVSGLGDRIDEGATDWGGKCRRGLGEDY